MCIRDRLSTRRRGRSAAISRSHPWLPALAVAAAAWTSSCQRNCSMALTPSSPRSSRKLSMSARSSSRRFRQQGVRNARRPCRSVAPWLPTHLVPTWRASSQPRRMQMQSSSASLARATSGSSLIRSPRVSSSEPERVQANQNKGGLQPP
eukprot:6047703-Pyramimonas_sp.AAC.1